MKHPFYKILYKALNKSSEDGNFVLIEAEKMRKKGYAPKEIYGVLQSLKKGLIEDRDIEIIAEAMGEFEEYID